MTKNVTISINGLSDVYEFVRESSKVDGDVLLKRGQYVVDAKSFLGVLSIDVSQNAVITYPDDAIEFDEYIAKFKKTN
jgi:phosphotransferase system HPr-like phosphotransfer protein